MISDFKEIFREEAYELLNSLEASLLSLEEDPRDQDAIGAVFRAMHTVKGSAAMFGLQEIADFAHEVENMLDLVRSGTLPVSEELISVTLSARDHIRVLLDNESTEERSLEGAEILSRVQQLIGNSRASADSDRPAEAVPSGTEQASRRDGSESERSPAVTYRIRFAPHEEVYKSGTRPLRLLQELRELGEYSCVPHLAGIPRLSELDEELCMVSWDMLLTTAERENAIRDVFIFVEDSSELLIEEIDNLSVFENDSYKRVGQILVERGAAQAEAVENAAGGQRRLGEILIEEGVDREEVTAALAEQQHVRQSRERAQKELSANSVRVKSDKLDHLVDLVGEIVTLQARLSSTVAETKIPGLTAIVESFERLTDELRDSTMSIRMLPIGTTFAKFRRLVRDLSTELGKSVSLVTEGGETELDKTVIERLSDPLVHVIRNSIDHGIELPEVRAENGKREEGTVRLTAEHAGATVIISVSDDGAGLNTDAIRRKAVERAVIDGSETLSDKELQQLIFSAGFSTTENVTSVSGRGVGMDVVCREIESLGGSVEIESEAGSGSTVRLHMPLTLAIIDGLQVQLGSENYVFPLSAVEECIELPVEDAAEEGAEQHIINNRGEALPYVRLRELFDMEEAPRGTREQVVVTRGSVGKVGYVVDRVVGDFQTVIKNLGEFYRNLEGISGATILGDGSVALILDVQRLSDFRSRAQVYQR